MFDKKIEQMLNRYELNTIHDHENALKEIIQEVVLLGLWRSKFYEKAVFYGGSALRILYELDRFSEDLNFSLIQSEKKSILKNILVLLNQSWNSGVLKFQQKKKIEKIKARLIQLSSKQIH